MEIDGIMEKRKIGILTHWSIPNYGAFLQAYALRNVIQQLYPSYDVKQIAYMNEVHAKMYYALEIHELFAYWLINPHFYMDLTRRLLRSNEIKSLRKFKDYYNFFIPHSKEYSKNNINESAFDYLVLGSDILWDYSISFYNHDEVVFGHHINTSHCVSYAASFGTVKRESVHPDYVIEGLNKIEAASVRDDNSKNIYEDITNNKATVVLDPTLLWDFKSDINVFPNSFEEEYIVIYGTFDNQADIDEIIRFCRAHNLKSVFIAGPGDSCPWCDVYIKSSDLTPFEWCGYIRNAYAVITSAFHGLMFGIIYEKRIGFKLTKFMECKASTIIKNLCLEDILLKGKPLTSQLESDWDYESINKRIDALKKLSIDFIKSSIPVENN